VVREIENAPTEGGDKPKRQVQIADCGELEGEAYEKAADKPVDPTGDSYEEFPEDQGEDIPGAEIVKIATDLKSLGNANSTKDFSLALKKYQKGLRYLQEYPEPLESDPPELGKQLSALKYALSSNATLMCLQVTPPNYEDAVKNASTALSVEGLTDVQKGKALYRRGKGFVGKKNEDEGIKDLEEASKLCSTDAKIKKDLDDVKKVAAERRKKEKAQYSKFFQ